MLKNKYFQIVFCLFLLQVAFISIYASFDLIRLYIFPYLVEHDTHHENRELIMEELVNDENLQKEKSGFNRQKKLQQLSILKKRLKFINDVINENIKDNK